MVKSDSPDPRVGPDPFLHSPRPWRSKFGDALRGILVGIRGQSSFRVHALAAVAVIALAALLRMRLVEWGLLVLCITIVCTAELFNSALEYLARAIDANVNPHLRDALDIASGAVLVAALGASLVGSSLFLARLAAVQ
jgi:diacylglycerol kinase